MTKSKIHSDSTNLFSDFHVREANLGKKTRSNRLREAVRKIGGGHEAARRSGVPLGTLNAYLAGGEMKLSNVVALSRACGFSVEWLVTGQEAASPSGQTPEIPGPPPSAPTATDPGRPPRLFNTVHAEKLAGAMTAVMDEFSRDSEQPPMIDVVKAALILYDLMNRPGSFKMTVTQLSPEEAKKLLE